MLQKTARRLSIRNRRSSGSKALASTSPSPTNSSSASFHLPDSPQFRNHKISSTGSNNSDIVDSPKSKSKKDSENGQKNKQGKSRSESPKIYLFRFIPYAFFFFFYFILLASKKEILNALLTVCFHATR
ncbi:hypothetical protein Btru_012155 [Bulinus truncatus]|nr:hypothetical protein Btru_012155 [Bulinus truncatus]